MSKREWQILSGDILERIVKIEKYNKDISFEDFAYSSLIIDAVVRNLEIIGEASNQIPNEIQKIYTSSGPWFNFISARESSNLSLHE